MNEFHPGCRPAFSVAPAGEHNRPDFAQTEMPVAAAAAARDAPAVGSTTDTPSHALKLSPLSFSLISFVFIHSFTLRSTSTTTTPTLIMSDALIHAASGSIGGGVAMALTYPLVNVSTRVAVSKAPKDQQRTTLQEVAHIVKHEGVKGLYSGLSTSLFGIALTNGVYTASYEEVRAALMRRRSSGGSHAVGALSTVEGIIAGMIAGA